MTGIATFRSVSDFFLSGGIICVRITIPCRALAGHIVFTFISVWLICFGDFFVKRELKKMRLAFFGRKSKYILNDRSL